jgi:predicted trehalose synthase
VHSLDYAAASALYEHDAIRPESRGALQLRSEDWRRRAEQVFLAGYRAAIGDCPSFPRNEA